MDLRRASFFMADTSWRGSCEANGPIPFVETRLLSFVLTVIWLAVAGSALVAGLDYYLLPLDQRAFSDLAPLFAPTGLVGQGFGIVGATLILIGVAGYSARKRFRFLARFGALKYWLQVHIFLCTLGPFLVLLHTTFKFGGIVSIAFWSMAIVVASGIFGRYVYVRIPKTINGRFLSLDAVGEQVRELSRVIADSTGLPASDLDDLLVPAVATPSGRGLVGALAFAVREDLRQRKHLRGLRSFLRGRGVPPALRGPVMDLAAEQRRLVQQTLVLRPFQRLFRYWHVIHLPLATVMFLVLGIHVAVSILFGYTWIFR
jgi:hypothetical protein